MSNNQKKLLGLVVESNKWGFGLVWREGKYDTLSIKLPNGIERTGLKEDTLRIVGEKELFENKDLLGILKQGGLFGHIKRPYVLSEAVVEKKKEQPSLKEMLLATTQGTSSATDAHVAGPWVCQDCFMTFDPAIRSVDKINDAKVAVKFSEVNKPICPYCNSINTRYIADMGPILNSDIDNVPGIQKLLDIVESGDISDLKGRKVTGVSDLISVGIITKDDLFGSAPKHADETLWEEAANTVWRSGKLINGMANTINYNNFINTWANLHKLQEGYYPALPIIENIRTYFDGQSRKFSEFVSYLKNFNQGELTESKHGKLKELRSAIKDEKVVNESIDELNRIKRELNHVSKPEVNEKSAIWGFGLNEEMAEEFADMVREDFYIKNVDVAEKNGEYRVTVVAENTDVFEEIDAVLKEDKYEVPKYATKFGKIRTQVEGIIESLERVDLGRHVQRLRANI